MLRKKTVVVIKISIFIGFIFLFRLESSSLEKTGSIIFKNVRVFDGDSVIPEAAVVISEGKIESVFIGKTLLVPKGYGVIEGEGMTLLPGLFDSHVHVMGKETLTQALVFGVTTVVDMFMDVQTMANIKKEQKLSAGDKAYLVSSGTLATSPGGHGTEYGLAIPTLSSPEDAPDFVSNRIKEGSDFIKIIYDDGSTYGYNRPTLSQSTIAAVIKSAHEKGKMAIIHAASLDNCVFALKNDVDGLAHLFFNNDFDPNFGRIAAEKNCFVIPTLSVLLGMSKKKGEELLASDPFLKPYLKPDDVQSLKMSFPFSTGEAAYTAAEKALRLLRQEKVPILAGTDAPNPGTAFGASIHQEMQLLVNAGLTPLEALRSATSIPAKIFGLEDKGRIKAGFSADLVLVNGHPDQNITATRDIIGVWRAGIKVDRRDYLEKVKAVWSNVEKMKKIPPPKDSEAGEISCFDEGKIDSRFGYGWVISTDMFIGGKSKAEFKLVEEGAEESAGALEITGEIIEGGSITWAGAMFSPGPQMMSPVNLSSKKQIQFWAKGDPKTFTVMIFAQSLGFIPASVNFKVDSNWKKYVIPFSSFNIEGYDIMGIFFGASGELGAFELVIDNIHLQ